MLTRHPLLRLLGRLRPIAWQAAGAYGAAIAASLLALAVPLAVRSIIDAAVGARPDALDWLPGDLDPRGRLVAAAVVLVVLAVAAAALSFAQRYGTAWVGRTVASDFRLDLFDQLLRLDMAYHAQRSVGRLMTRVTDDTEKVRQFAATAVSELISIAVLLIGSMVVLLGIDPVLGAVALAPVPVLGLLAVLGARALTPRFQSVQQATGGLTARLQESLAQIRVLQAFTAERRTGDAYAVENEDLYGRRLSVARVFTSVFPLMTALLGVTTALVLLVGGRQVLTGELSIGTLVAFNSYIALLGMPVRRLGFFLNIASRAKVSAERVYRVLDREPILTEAPGAADLDGVRGEAGWRDVGFAYEEGRPVLSGATLVVRPGEHVAVVGSSGSGKTTLVQLLTRLYDPDEGSVTLDGADLRGLRRDTVRRSVGFVEQEAFLFSATVHDNVAFARPDATRAQVEWAAGLAGAHDFVTALPDGYDTLVGERGVTLSGGQRQRLALARALRVAPPVLVLDDAVSAVDARTEARIREALRAATRDGARAQTVVSVAQRLSTILSADRIVVLDGGRIVEQGTHAELVRAEGPYAAMFQDTLALTGGAATDPGPGARTAVAPADAAPAAVDAGAAEPAPGALAPADGRAGAPAPAAPARPRTGRRLLTLLRPHLGRLAWATVLMLVTTAATLARPQLIAWAIDDGIRGGSAAILTSAVVALGAAALVETAAGGWQRYVLIQVGVRTITDLRTRMFRHLLRLDQSFHDRNRPGDLMSRVTSDAETLSDFVTWTVITGVQNVLTLVGIVWILLRADAGLALTTFAVVPLMAAATWRWVRRTRLRYAEVAKAVGEVSARAEESLSGIRVVKTLGQERSVAARFARANDLQRTEDLGTDKVSAAFYPVIDVLSDTAVAIVLGLGGLQVLNGTLEPGVLVAFLLYVQQFFDPIRDLTTRLDSIQDATAAGNRIFEVLDAPVTIVDRPGAPDLTGVRGHVRFEDVTFGYLPDRPVLHAVDLDIPAGTTVALVGETGAGKTTIARLLGRFYEVDDGRVTIDGHDLRDVTLASLRAQLAWVPQEVGLFAGSILDNLRYGRPGATEEEVRAAAAAVGADDVFAALAEGYATRLDEGGGGLSAGQRQLVAFTRALVADPALVVLDEATASVDVQTEARMQAGLRRLLAGRTAVVIAHRLSTIVGADLIAVVHGGRVVETGTHADLLAAGGRYADLYRTQVAAEGVLVPTP